jgi:hypothetical protein
LAAALLCGCSHTQPAEKIAENGGLYNKFVPAEKTSLVGKTDSVYLADAFVIVNLDLDRKPFPVGSFFVARDEGGTPTAVLQATKQATRSEPYSQGMMVVSGQLLRGYDIVEPGPELARLVQENIDKYLIDHSQPPTLPPANEPKPPKSMLTTPLPATDAPAPAGPTVPPPSA